MKKINLKIAILTFICFLQALSTVNSQNIISNNDFELYSTLPTSPAQITNAIGWDDVLQSSDYIYGNTVSWNLGSIFPPEIGGAYSGNGFVGISTYGDLTGSSEAIGQDISSSPIIATTNYSISLYAKKTSGGSHSNSCGGIALYGFTTPPPLNVVSNHVSNLPGATLLWSSSIVSDSLWKNYNGSFQSCVAINYIVITLDEIPLLCNQYVFIDSINIEPNSIEPNSVIISNDTCLQNSIPFSILTGAIISNVTWNFDDPSSGANNSSTSLTPSHLFSASGTYNVRSIINFSCNVDTIFKTLTITNCDSILEVCELSLVVGNDTCLQSNVPFSILTTETISNITWNFGDPLSGANNNSTSLTPTHRFSATGTYNVRSIVNFSCGVDTIFKTLTITNCDSTIDVCELYTPNSFTPNGDNVNDNFYPITICTFEYYEFLIFNRWGEVIFKTSNQTDKWDGKYKGSDCPIGVYFYQITYKFPTQQTKIDYGTITLLDDD
jgi:gliding motility-associated-like protein